MKIVVYLDGKHDSTEVKNKILSVLPDAKYMIFDAEDENALTIIKKQQAEIDRLEYVLLGVMHFVDKWLDGAELKQDEVNRASAMREKTLQIVEKQQAEIKRLKVEAISDVLNRLLTLKGIYVKVEGEFMEWEPFDELEFLFPEEMAGE